jgi:hypothetical protein
VLVVNRVGAHIMAVNDPITGQAKTKELQTDANRHLERARAMEDLAAAEHKLAEVDRALGLKDEASLMAEHAAEHYINAAEVLDRVVEDREQERELIRKQA